MSSVKFSVVYPDYFIYQPTESCQIESELSEKKWFLSSFSSSSFYPLKPLKSSSVSSITKLGLVNCGFSLYYSSLSCRPLIFFFSSVPRATSKYSKDRRSSVEWFSLYRRARAEIKPVTYKFGRYSFFQSTTGFFEAIPFLFLRTTFKLRPLGATKNQFLRSVARAVRL